jgi:hypothetical protein
MLHYVVDETQQRAVEVSAQSYPGSRIIAMRDSMRAE